MSTQSAVAPMTVIEHLLPGPSSLGLRHPVGVLGPSWGAGHHRLAVLAAVLAHVGVARVCIASVLRLKFGS